MSKIINVEKPDVNTAKVINEAIKIPGTVILNKPDIDSVCTRVCKHSDSTNASPQMRLYPVLPLTPVMWAILLMTGLLRYLWLNVMRMISEDSFRVKFQYGWMFPTGLTMLRR